jgi:hypothetical protein
LGLRLNIKEMQLFQFFDLYFSNQCFLIGVSVIGLNATVAATQRALNLSHPRAGRLF